MHEIELKFQVPAAQRAAVDAAVAGSSGQPRMRLQAAYFDTAERTLAGAGVALRLRREGRRWVQTLKGTTDSPMTRLEHNAARGGAAAMPPIEPALHHGTPAGEALARALAGRPTEALTVVYRTDILRRTRLLRTRGADAPPGQVELAYDSGSIRSGDRRAEVHELEVELVAGSLLAVLDTARQWLPRFGLWLDSRSKAERGDLLARGESMAAARQATPVRLAAEMSVAQAWRAVLAACADQIITNASQIAAGEHTSEHVHQLRVGLRRLRSALRLFDDGPGAEAVFGEAAAALFRGLAGSRDRTVIESAFAAGLLDAMRVAGVPGDAPLPPAVADVAPTELMRRHESQMLLLDLHAALHTDAAGAVDAAVSDGADAGGPLRDRLARRLNRWHRQVIVDAKRFAELDDERRHRLRKRAKRLRYATEFCEALFERRAVRRYLRALRALQERLGEVSDVAMALAAFGQHRDADPRNLFALGWLAARREQLIAAAAPELKGFVKVARYWKH